MKTNQNNVSWVGYIDWELEQFHGDDYSIMNGSVKCLFGTRRKDRPDRHKFWAPHSFEFVENLKKKLTSTTLTISLSTTVK